MTLRDRTDRFASISILTLEALRIPAETGLGTIHLYNAEEQRLELRGSCGQIQHRERAERQSVRHAEGVISWVVHRRRALLIRDLQASEFRSIHIWLNDAVRSELAAPLEVEGNLIGVICLEYTQPNRFEPHHVRSVWYRGFESLTPSHTRSAFGLTRWLRGRFRHAAIRFAHRERARIAASQPDNPFNNNDLQQI